jgi:hypothetical protein
MKELLDKWSDIQRQPRHGVPTVGSVQQRISEELQILEALRAAGCTHIPDEPFDVQFFIDDRRRLLREMQERLS